MYCTFVVIQRIIMVLYVPREHFLSLQKIMIAGPFIPSLSQNGAREKFRVCVACCMKLKNITQHDSLY
jgi:hypothetical protein